MERVSDVFISNYRARRKGELTDDYDKELRQNRRKLVGILLIFSVILFLSIKFFVMSEDKLMQYLINVGLSIGFFFLAYLPFGRRLKSRYSERVTGIDEMVEAEILNLKKQASI